MNPGYLTLITTWFLILLTWIGVFDRFFAKLCIKKKWIQCYLWLSFLGTGFSVPLPLGGDMSIVAFLIPLFIGIWVWTREEDSQRVHVITASFLIGTSIFLLRLLLQLDPILMFMNEQYMQAALVIFLLFVAAKGPRQQYILLIFGVTFGEVSFQYYLWKKMGTYQLGSYVYSDLLWMSLSLLIVLRVVLALIHRTLNRHCKNDANPVI